MAEITAPGPWDNEPDHLAFQAHGLSCEMHRTRWFGTWCGYVGVPATHPLHGVDYGADVAAPAGALDRETDVDSIGIINLVVAAGRDDLASRAPLVILLDCHGGLTYSKAHDDGLWWFGFDCGHSDDLMPKRPDTFAGNTYRDMTYVREQTERLAAQLAAWPAADTEPAP